MWEEQLLITCSVLLYTLSLASSPIFLGLGAYEREVCLRIVHMSPEMGGHVKPPLALISRSLCFDCDSGFQRCVHQYISPLSRPIIAILTPRLEFALLFVLVA